MKGIIKRIYNQKQSEGMRTGTIPRLFLEIELIKVVGISDEWLEKEIEITTMEK